MSVVVGASWETGKQSSIPRMSSYVLQYEKAPANTTLPSILSPHSYLSSSCPLSKLIFFPDKKKNQQNSIYKKGQKEKIFGKIGDRRRREGNRHGSREHFPLGRTCNHYPTSSYTSLGLEATGSDSSLSPIHTHFPIPSQADRFHGVSNALNRKSPENVEILNPNPSPFPTFRATELRIRFSPPPHRKPRKEKFKPAKSWMRRALCFPSWSVEGWGACLSGGSYGGWWVRIRCIEVEGL